ncbi:hypothetical protein ACFLYA_00870, partial [Candidatus Dependentiae bacterium]
MEQSELEVKRSEDEFFLVKREGRTVSDRGALLQALKKLYKKKPSLNKIYEEVQEMDAEIPEDVKD